MMKMLEAKNWKAAHFVWYNSGLKNIILGGGLKSGVGNKMMKVDEDEVRN